MVALSIMCPCTQHKAIFGPELQHPFRLEPAANNMWLEEKKVETS